MAIKPLSQYSLDSIIRRCGEESHRQRKQETGYCFELFRRALVEQDGRAWQAVQQQYHKLLFLWIHKTAADGLALEIREDLLQEAWFRFWRTLSRHSNSMTERFQHVGALLKYLHQCAVAACLDEQRRWQRRNRLQQALIVRLPVTPDNTLEQETWEQWQQDEKLSLILEWIRTEVTDPHEQLIIYLSYECELTPAEIASGYPKDFVTVKDVHRIKERILKRARRALAAQT